MKIKMTTAALALSTASLLAQTQAHAQTQTQAQAQAQTGVSRPDQSPITTASPDEQVRPSSQLLPRTNPDAEIVTSAPSAVSVQDDASAYHPYHAGAGAYRPDASASLNARPTTALSSAADHDVDADIVTSVPERPGEIAEGTLLKVRMNNALSTVTTRLGSSFSATVSDDVVREGRVVIPAGSLLDGQVTEVRGGRRITGRAAIHLEPRRVTLPDGTYYVLHAQVIDTGEEGKVKVGREGTILRRDHPKEMLAILSLTTGSGAVAGAMIGGGVGAAVGAGLGAGVSTIIWLKEDRQAALPKETALTFSLTSPIMMRPLQDGAQLR